MVFSLLRDQKARDVQHNLYLWHDDYRQFVIFPGLTDVVNLDYSAPRLVVADEKKRVEVESLDVMWTRSTQCEGTDFIHLTTKDQLADNCTDYLPNLISMYKIIAE